MTRQPLDKAVRRALEATVVKARDIAEQAATQAVKRLGVGDVKPADYLSDEQRKLRTRLRAHGRQLGDSKDGNGQQTIDKLVTEIAYEHWHRMLFARFLEQNSLLMYDNHTQLTLAECNELVQDPDVARDDLERRCKSGWELAGVLASKMLPQIFRIDSPVFELDFAPEHQRSLEQLVTGLALETFQAQDSLGWVYQFWQSKRKKEVNDSEVKIGADELSPVTQLFTEPYMVSFLLDNSLGAWWAGQRLSDSDWQNAGSEEELREKAAIPGVPLSYLRFVKDGAAQRWQPASGTFDAWPKQLRELKTLDPCCGSGHFLVAAFFMLVPMRMMLESLTAQQAIDRVLSENLHGLELDQRCVELAAFAVALEAWRFQDAGGYRNLPELHLACSGLSISAAKEDWMALGGDNVALRSALEELYRQFKDASLLGSLINPEVSLGKGTLLELQWEEVGPLLTKALGAEKDDQRVEIEVVAQGIAKSAELLSNTYHCVMTNPPYLGEKKQSAALRDFSRKNFPDGRADLSTTFVLRGEQFCAGKTQCLVLPQNWLYQSSYQNYRRSLLKDRRIRHLSQLGANAFDVSVGADVLLLILSEGGEFFNGQDLTDCKNSEGKSESLMSSKLTILNSKVAINHGDARISLQERNLELPTLESYTACSAGILNGDTPRFVALHWEVTSSYYPAWSFFQRTTDHSKHFGGMSNIILWEGGSGQLRKLAVELKERLHDADRRGNQAWGKRGIAISQMGKLPASTYVGDLYDQSVAMIIPKSDKYLPAISAYCESTYYSDEVRKIDKNLKVTVSTLLKVPFDLDHWIKVAAEQYPKGLPQPYTNDPTQWIFHGHPCGSVTWDEKTKWTAHGELRIDDSVLQVAVARLLGYRWPAELGPEMELATEQREWVQRCLKLDPYVDDDGIVCLPAVRGEKAADQRLEALLQAAYGDAWTTPLKNRLLETVGSKSLSLWLRDKFFEQHCKLFQHRPFIWHIWDGLKDGFSALVNYHKLDKAGLERLIYTYLGDWIRTQQSGMANGEDGAQERLLAAEALKRELEAILEGEAPYDIFVRWKPLAEQPIGWTPDLNDGVRLNIRPFLSARDVGKKGAGILRWAPNIKWGKDRGKDVESAPWYALGLQYAEGEGARINDHHLSLAEKQAARS